MEFIDMNSLIAEAIGKLNAQKEASIIEQLNALVRQGVLIIEENQPMFIQDGQQIRISQSIRLVPKEHEYIKSLEEENNMLKERIRTYEQER